MRGRKLQKQLMGIGVQRNDARAFIDVYRKIKQAGRMDLFPELQRIDQPEKLPLSTDLNVVCLSVSQFVSHDLIESSRFDSSFEDFVKRNLASKLADELLLRKAVRLRSVVQNEFAKEFRADIRVVIPGGMTDDFEAI